MLRRRCQMRVLAAGAFVSLTLVACSSGSEEPSRAQDAASELGQQFGADPGQVDCLASGFDDDPQALSAFTPAGSAEAVPADDALDAVGAVALRCIPPTLVATRLAAAMAAGYGTVTPEQQACLYDGLVALDDRQRTVLLVGPIVMSADPMSSRSLEYGEVTAAVRDACGVSIDGTTVAPGGPTIEGDTSDTSITR